MLHTGRSAYAALRGIALRALQHRHRYQSTHPGVELLVFVGEKENLDVGAICPEKGESSLLRMLIHADPRSRDAIASDSLGVISQIANPQPPLKDATVGDAQFRIRHSRLILDSAPHPCFAEVISLWDKLVAVQVPNACTTDDVPFFSSVLCSTAFCSGRREVLRLRIAAD